MWFAMHAADMGLDQSVERRPLQAMTRHRRRQGLQHRMAYAGRVGEDALHLLAPPGVAHLGQQRLGHARRNGQQLRLEGVEGDQIGARLFVCDEAAGQPAVEVGGANLGIKINSHGDRPFDH